VIPDFRIIIILIIHTKTHTKIKSPKRNINKQFEAFSNVLDEWNEIKKKEMKLKQLKMKKLC
jgi:hypothetical protein